jgi:4'-phosphopantetheinyl transferase
MQAPGTARSFRLSVLPLNSDAGVRVWQLDYALDTAVDARTLESLAEEERARMDRFVRQADRVRFAATRAALRELLADRLGGKPAAVPIQTGPHGKPLLAGSGIEFNVSHSGEHGLLAFASGAVGVDIEQIDSAMDWSVVATTILGAAELGELARLDQRTSFLRCYEYWTGKEAISKAIGIGLFQDPRSFALAFGAESVRLVCEEWMRGADWEHVEIERLGAPHGYVAALAWIRPSGSADGDAASEIKTENR